MTKIYPFIAGNTLNSHEKFIKKLKKKGAKFVSSPEESDAIIVFCPIVSRFETDIESALSSLPESGSGKRLIVVAMHPTFQEDYTLPNHREHNHAVELLVDCLFYQTKGLLKCPRNKTAIKMVRKTLCPRSNAGCAAGIKGKGSKRKNEVEPNK